MPPRNTFAYPACVNQPENTCEYFRASVFSRIHLTIRSRTHIRQETLAHTFAHAYSTKKTLAHTFSRGYPPKYTCAHVLTRVRGRKHLLIPSRARNRQRTLSHTIANAYAPKKHLLIHLRACTRHNTLAHTAAREYSLVNTFAYLAYLYPPENTWAQFHARVPARKHLHTHPRESMRQKTLAKGHMQMR